MKVFVSATDTFACEVMDEVLRRGHEIVGVAPGPQNRLKDPTYVYALRKRLNPVSDGSRFTSRDVPDDTDLILSVFSRWMVPKACMDKTTYGGIGFHPSMLPRHRGCEAVKWAWKMGDAITGATVYWLSEQCDKGDILLQRPVFIDRMCDDYHKVWEDIRAIGPSMVADAIDMIEAGTAPRIPQDERFATWEPSTDRPRVPMRELPQLPAVQRGDETWT